MTCPGPGHIAVSRMFLVYSAYNAPDQDNFQCSWRIVTPTDHSEIKSQTIHLQIHSIIALQSGFNRRDIFLFMHFQGPVHLRRAAHQFHRSGIHHSQRRVAVMREVIEEDVWDGETTGPLHIAFASVLSFRENGTDGSARILPMSKDSSEE